VRVLFAGKSKEACKCVLFGGKVLWHEPVKKKYTRKQKRKASKIERGYKKRGVSSKEAARRAWATVNKSDKGGRKPGGGGRGKKRSKAPMRKGGRKGGRKKEKR
jgi:hypothetical protein